MTIGVYRIDFNNKNHLALIKLLNKEKFLNSVEIITFEVSPSNVEMKLDLKILKNLSQLNIEN